MAGRIRVYSGVSLDGFLAGEGDDLSWLPHPPEGRGEMDARAVSFDGFMVDVGAMLMGRRTFDVVSGMGVWPYGDVPVIVVTNRPVETAIATVRSLAGDVDALCEHALRVANGRDVYVDGGQLITQVLDAGRVDELILTVVPTLLGRGIPVYGGPQRHAFDLVQMVPYLGMAQLTLRPTATTRAAGPSPS